MSSIPAIALKDQGVVAEINEELVSVTDRDHHAIHDLMLRGIPFYSSLQIESLDDSLQHTLHEKYEEVLAGAYEIVVKELQAKWEHYGPVIRETTPFKIAESICHFLYQPPSFDSMAHPFQHHARDIQCMAWHPHANRLAVAHKDNCIYLYERVFGVSHWTCSVLKHKLMRKMTCIEWKPRSGGVLAVGCSYGVCVWDLYGKRGKDVPLESQGHLHPTACMSYFHSPGYTHISSVAWDPSLGSHCLVAASMATSSLVVYDTITHASTLLRRRGKGNRLLRWSPNGKRLYASNMSGKSHMWDTETWACIKVSHSPGLWVETACWSPDSRTLYYSMLGKRDLHVLHQSFAENKVVSSLVENHETSVMSKGRIVSVGGPIQQMAIDPVHGDRIAIVYEKCETVAVYKVMHNTPRMTEGGVAISFIGHVRGTALTMDQRGPTQAHPMNDTYPTHVSISPSPQGSLLSIAYDNNTISFIPQLYTTSIRS